jgi:hypothetical protein
MMVMISRRLVWFVVVVLVLMLVLTLVAGAMG